MRSPSHGPWTVCAQLRPILLRVVAAALVTVLLAPNVSAQIVRAPNWSAAPAGDLVFGADVAYDPVNGVYLMVMDREGSGINGRRLAGIFIDRAGHTIGTEFVIAGDIDFPRVVYSPNVSNGAGGTGGFLVTWSNWPDTSIYARRVAFPGAVVGSASVVGPGYGSQELAYSSASQVFGAGWANYYDPRDASFSRIAVNGLPLAAPTLLADGDAGRSWVNWNSLTDVAWHEARDEFGILYARRAAPWTLRFARVNPAGTLLDDRVVATIDAEPIAAALEFSPLTGNYIALWADPVTGRITGAELSPDGAVLATGPLPKSILGGENGMALAYNKTSGTFLLLGYSQLRVKNEQVRGLELNKHGAPHSSVIEVTSVPLNSNLFGPRVVAPSDGPEWLVTAGGSPRYVQVVSTSSTAGGSEIRLGARVTVAPPATDFNRDGRPDVVWQDDATGQASVWYMTGAQGNQLQKWNWLAPAAMPGWRIRAIADFNLDGVPDVVWQSDATRQVSVWYMGGAEGTTLLDWNWLSQSGVPGWTVMAANDINGDARPDLVWQNDSTGQVSTWFMGGQGGNVLQQWAWLAPNAMGGWRVVGLADFDGDNIRDIVWQHDTTRQVSIWYMDGADGTQFRVWNWLSESSVPGWRVVGVENLDRDGAPDLVWQSDGTREISVWYMGGVSGDVRQYWQWLTSGPVPGWTAVIR